MIRVLFVNLHVTPMSRHLIGLSFCGHKANQNPGCLDPSLAQKSLRLVYQGIKVRYLFEVSTILPSNIHLAYHCH
ncbi:hypothetical protein K443DRAFT_677752 [Laccaria amethystina LaAM-08-1]|uniref:Uncharacterized protein n=1 Tax=Laccaria amethystina LaAM-08-1 TaxID=1095629 RepID=A0A0C9WTA0_9AGAR|nr:hypothetical protein K443DRAFT_677752 [Laccaria amethystina LaAM-08-1]